jgi:hypothetical protein
MAVALNAFQVQCEQRVFDHLALINHPVTSRDVVALRAGLLARFIGFHDSAEAAIRITVDRLTLWIYTNGCEIIGDASRTYEIEDYDRDENLIQPFLRDLTRALQGDR